MLDCKEVKSVFYASIIFNLLQENLNSKVQKFVSVAQGGPKTHEEYL